MTQLVSSSLLGLTLGLAAAGCATSRGAAAPPPASASAEVRALDFLVGEYQSGDASVRCAFEASGDGVACVEKVASGDAAETDRFVVRWSAEAHAYRLDAALGAGAHFVGSGEKVGARLVFTTAGEGGAQSRRYTFERDGDVLRLVAETCVKASCQVDRALRLEPSFVAPVDDRNG